jgi:flagellar FliL protein
MSDTETQPPESEAKPSGVAKARLPLIALAAVGLAVGAGTGALLVGPVLARKLGKAPPVTADSLSADSSEAHAEGNSETAPSVHLLENLVLNPAGSGGSRFLLLSIAIECKDAEILSSMEVRDAELRDIILTSLGNKTVDALTDVNGRERIKSEIQTAIDERFGKKAVSRIYFPQFVVQ